MTYSHWIYKEGFTSKLTTYFYLLPLTRRNAVLGALLARVLERGSRDYPSVEAIQAREDELYGAVAYFDVNVYGSLLVFEVSLVFPDYRYFGKEELEADARAFMDSLLYEPLLVEGIFKEDIFLQEKSMLAQDLDSMLKDPQSFAMRRVMELLFDDSPAGVYRYGDKKSLEEVGGEDLYLFYKDMLESPLYVYHHGRDKKGDEGSWEEMIMEEVLVAPLEREVLEDKDISQSVTVQVYQVPVGFKDERAYSYMLLSHLLGGSGTSFLFKKVREERGLCYSIYSRYDRYRKSLFIVSGHEKSSYEELVGITGDIIESLARGEFSQEELREAKQDLSIGLSSMVDSQVRLLKDTFIRDLFSDERDIGKRIEKIEAVSKEDVASAARELLFSLAYSVRNK